MPGVYEYEVFARSPWYIHNVMALASYLLIFALSDRAQRVIRSRGLWAFSGVCLIMSSILQTLAPQALFTQLPFMPFLLILLADIGSSIITVIRFDIFIAIKDNKQRGFVVLAGTALQILFALVARSLPETMGLSVLVLFVIGMIIAIWASYRCIDQMSPDPQIVSDVQGSAFESQPRPHLPPLQIWALFLLAIVLNAIRSAADGMGSTHRPDEEQVLGVVFLVTMAVLVATALFKFKHIERIIPLSISLLAIGVAGLTLIGSSHALFAVAFSAASYYLFGAFFWIVTAHYAIDRPNQTVWVASLTHLLFTLGLSLGSLLYRAFDAISAGSLWLLLITNVAVIATFLLGIRGGFSRSAPDEQADRTAPTVSLQDTIEKDCEIVAAEHRLTQREKETLIALAMGETIRAIAVKRGVSENTVKTHAAHAYQKIGVHSREELMELIYRIDSDRVDLSQGAQFPQAN